MQKSNVDFYPVLLLSILADTLLRLHTGYWARAGLLALPASAAVLAAVLLLVSTSWQGNALLQKVLCVLLAISSALEILRLHALFGSVYPGTLGLAGTCFVVLAPVIYLRREPALRQTANALLVFGAACMAIMVLSVAPRLRVPNLHAAPLTGQDWQASMALSKILVNSVEVSSGDRGNAVGRRLFLSWRSRRNICCLPFGLRSPASAAARQ